MYTVTSRLLLGAASVSLLCNATTLAGPLVVVVDVKGHAVQSDIVRSQPSPEERLGRTDPGGRLQLAKNCAPGSVLRADPPPAYYKQGSPCEVKATAVRIEVTPIVVIAQLESNMAAAQKAGNQAAIAQIASELAERSKYQDAEKALHYKNVATVALARVFSPEFNKDRFWSSGTFANLEAWDSNEGVAKWNSVCRQSDIVRCRPDKRTEGVRVSASEKLLRDIAKKNPKATVDKREGIKNTGDWLKEYSGKDKETLIFHPVDEHSLEAWKIPEDTGS